MHLAGPIELFTVLALGNAATTSAAPPGALPGGATVAEPAFDGRTCRQLSDACARQGDADACYLAWRLSRRVPSTDASHAPPEACVATPDLTSAIARACTAGSAWACVASAALSSAVDADPLERRACELGAEPVCVRLAARVLAGHVDATNAVRLRPLLAQACIWRAEGACEAWRAIEVQEVLRECEALDASGTQSRACVRLAAIVATGMLDRVTAARTAIALDGACRARVPSTCIAQAALDLDGERPPRMRAALDAAQRGCQQADPEACLAYARLAAIIDEVPRPAVTAELESACLTLPREADPVCRAANTVAAMIRCPTPGMIATGGTRGVCCWPGQRVDTSGGHCQGVPVCPRGWVASTGTPQCVVPITRP